MTAMGTRGPGTFDTLIVKTCGLTDQAKSALAASFET